MGFYLWAIKSAVAELLAEGKSVAHAHLRYIRPFPKNLGEILKNYETVLIPEINNGQLIKIIRDVYFVDAKGYNKIMGIPITKTELVEELKKVSLKDLTLISNPSRFNRDGFFIFS